MLAFLSDQCYNRIIQFYSRQVIFMLSPLSLTTPQTSYLSKTLREQQPRESTPVGRVQTEAPAAEPQSLGKMLPVAGKTETEGNVRTRQDKEGIKECQTCKNRKYQDGSDDPSVSFQTPTEIDPKAAASIVRSHEQEHVSHEQAKADREGRKVVSQTVTLHTAICPECGRVYISGGTTRTVTKGTELEEDMQQAIAAEKAQKGGFFSAWA